MSIEGVSSPPLPPAPPRMLPLQQASGSGFADSLRSQIRAQIERVITHGVTGGAGMSGGVQSQPSTTTARATALQQSLLGAASSATAKLANTSLATTGQWADLARSIGQQYLQPQAADVFVRQMALESGNFSPDVIYGRISSSAGAQGIAQLMPSSYPNVNRLDPVASLNAAAGTMRSNLQLFGGDLSKALAAYNAGTGTVTNAIKRLGPNWESGLPAETQRYLKELVGGGNA